MKQPWTSSKRTGRVSLTGPSHDQHTRQEAAARCSNQGAVGKRCEARVDTVERHRSEGWNQCGLHEKLRPSPRCSPNSNTSDYPRGCFKVLVAFNNTDVLLTMRRRLAQRRGGASGLLRSSLFAQSTCRISERRPQTHGGDVCLANGPGPWGQHQPDDGHS